ncbi:tRNA-uridine aminocarboxypropyltransferase [Vibrio furnissii]|uniref:tRNA-uridine aminocarboxypropyltransferase n=1 Tax=Vibrio furnissii TaxID=29494 RepID=UPI0030B96A04
MTPCPHCLLVHQCVCQQVPELTSALQLSLLMHDNERSRDTNTGRWLTATLPDCQAFSWSRVEPNAALKARIADPSHYSVLVYPGEPSLHVEDALKQARALHRKPHFILLDGTWQEAKKMERKSPWLKGLPRVTLSPQQLSQYRLRRNQSDGHLCTLEVGCELLRALDEAPQADALAAFFAQFMAIFQADKSGHRWPHP